MQPEPALTRLSKANLWNLRTTAICLVWLIAQPALAADPFDTAAKLASSPAGTQHSCPPTQDETAAWSLTEIIDAALCQNPQTRLAWANAKVAAAQWGETKAANLPTLDANHRSQRQWQEGRPFGSDAENILSLGLELNYLLYDFGGRQAKNEAAKQTLLAANYTQDATAQTVILAAIQAYYQWFANQQAAQATRVTENAAREALTAASLRHKIGSATRADLLQAQTAYAQTRLNRQTAEGSYRNAQGTLANVLGLEADTELVIEPPPLQHPEHESATDIRPLIELAKRQRPDLAAVEAQITAAQAKIKVAEATGKPSISLFAHRTKNYAEQTPNSQTSAAGIALTIPIFTGYSVTYQKSTAIAQWEALTAARDLSAHQVSLEVWQSYQNLQTASVTFSTSLELLSSAEQAEQVALGQYQSGVGNILNVLTAQANLASARLQNIQAQYNWFISKATLARAVGQLEQP